MDNTISEVKNMPEGISSRINEAEEQISELEDRMVENHCHGNEDSLRDPWDNIKRTNIHIIGIPEGEE